MTCFAVELVVRDRQGLPRHGGVHFSANPGRKQSKNRCLEKVCEELRHMSAFTATIVSDLVHVQRYEKQQTHWHIDHYSVGMFLWDHHQFSCLYKYLYPSILFSGNHAHLICSSKYFFPALLSTVIVRLSLYTRIKNCLISDLSKPQLVSQCPLLFPHCSNQCCFFAQGFLVSLAADAVCALVHAELQKQLNTFAHLQYTRI